MPVDKTDKPGLVRQECQRWAHLGRFTWVGAGTVAGEDVMPGNIKIRPLGGAVGCLVMIIISIVASILLTILANALLR